MFEFLKWFKGTSDAQSSSSARLSNMVSKLSKINHKLTVASRMVQEGPHEIAAQGERFVVLHGSWNGNTELFIGQFVWKFWNDKGEYEYYTAGDWSCRGEHFIMRSENSLCKVMVEGAIQNSQIVSTMTEPQKKVPVRIAYQN